MAANMNIGCLNELCMHQERRFRLLHWAHGTIFHRQQYTGSQENSCFLLAMGAEAYKLLWNVVVPDSPKDKRFNDLVKILCMHMKPKPLVIAERFKFYINEYTTKKNTRREEEQHKEEQCGK